MKEKLALILPFAALIGAAVYGTLMKGAPQLPPLFDSINGVKQWETTHVSGLLPFFPLILTAWEQRHRPLFSWRNEIALFLIVLYLATLTVGWMGCSKWLWNYSDHFALKTTTACVMSSVILMARQIGPLSLWSGLFVLLYSCSDFLFLSQTAHRYHTGLEVVLGLLVGAVLIALSALIAKRVTAH